MSSYYKKMITELFNSRDMAEHSLLQSLRELEEMGISPGDSLLDSEGFPRTDIDLYRVTTLRSSIASKYVRDT